MSESLFEEIEIARNYQRYRTDYYGSDIEKEIIPFLREKLPESSDSCAVDVGCGSGQLTRVLSPYFTKVIGVDCSQAQIKVAQEVTIEGNVEYIVGQAEDLSNLKDGSVDLVTTAGSIQYFQGELFNAEVERILKPGGCVLIVLFGQRSRGYSIIANTDNDDVIKTCSELMDDIYHFVFQNTTPNAQAVMSSGNFVIPKYHESRHFEKTVFKPLESLDGFVGFLKSVGTVRKYTKEHPEKEDVSEIFKRRFVEILSVIATYDEPVQLSLGLFIRGFLYRKPNNIA